MLFVEMEEDYEENRLVLGLERKYFVLNILSLRWLLDRYLSQVLSVKQIYIYSFFYCVLGFIKLWIIFKVVGFDEFIYRESIDRWVQRIQGIGGEGKKVKVDFYVFGLSKWLDGGFFN